MCDLNTINVCMIVKKIAGRIVIKITLRTVTGISKTDPSVKIFEV